jgi:hypothetical protein
MPTEVDEASQGTLQLEMGRQFPDRWQHGSKSDRKCNSNRPDRAHLSQPSGARRRSGHSNRDLSRTRSDGVRQLLPLCSGLTVHVRQLTSLRSSQFSRPGFSATHFLGHCFGLIPASCSFASSAFPVPPLTRLVLPIKQPLALEAEATRLCVRQENGARKRRKFSYVLPQLYNSRRVRWSRPGATSNERQWFEIHRAVGRHTALSEECR